MNKPPIVVEIPTNATDQVVRIQLEEVQKAVKQARSGRNEQVIVRIERGECPK